VYRRGPTYRDALPPEHEINKLFVDWYLVEGGESGLLRDVHRAVRLAGLCNKHFPDRSFEVVEVAEGDALPRIGGRFLGFDLASSGVASVLHGGHQSWTWEIKVESPAGVLCKVMRRYFSPRLNEFALFQRLEDASFCLQAMTALQTYKPGFFEGCDLDGYQPWGVYLVWGQDNWPPVPGGESHWQPGAKRPPSGVV
jgi:hypothetical protein